MTIDASVFVSAFTPSEPAHTASKAFLHKIQQSGVSILLPTLAIVEIAAAIGRGQRRPDLGHTLTLEVGRLP